MADINAILRKAKSRAQVADREKKSTAKLAAEAEAESQRARREFKKAKKASKKANKIARKARKAADAARKHLAKVSRRTKKSASPADTPEANRVAEVPSATRRATKAVATIGRSTRPTAAPPKRVKRRAPRSSRQVVAQQHPEPADEPDTFEMSEADLVRELP